MLGKKIIFTFIFLLTALTSFCQKGVILKVQHDLDSLRSVAPLEKIYLHLDKQNYLLGDTIWYKAYVTDGSFGTPSAISGIVYVELTDARGEVVQRSRQMLVAGSTYGDLFLDPAELKPGSFRLRAYTQWMQNFGSDYFFDRRLEVLGNYQQEWSVQLAPLQFADTTSKQVLDIQMKIQPIDGKPFRVQPVVMELESKRKQLDEQKLIVDTDGVFKTTIALNKKLALKDVDVVLKQENAEKVRFPLSDGWPQKQYDVQFLPESGQWLAQRPCVMGVKIVDNEGKGQNARGIVRDAQGKTVATFQCQHKGMGSIRLPALPVGKYMAHLIFEDGYEKDEALPIPETSGIILHYEPTRATNTFQFQVMVADSLNPAYHNLMLIAQSRGVMCYGALLKPVEKQLETTIPQSYFPEGVVHFMLYSADGRPLAHRMVYHQASIQPGLKLSIEPHQATYHTRDSVALVITATDSLGKGVVGNFSLAVTDDGQYQSSSWAPNIWNSYYLSSELQGTVEEPGYYFSDDSAATTALDHLLLTQGWRKYDLSWLNKKKDFSFKPEPRFAITGTAENAFGKKLKQVPVVLFAKGKSTFFADTLTNEMGQFTFDHFPPFDTIGFVIQARNRRNKSFNIGIELDPDAPFPPLKKPPTQPHSWFVNLDTTLRQRLLDQRAYQKNMRVLHYQADPNTIMLEEVAVNAKKVVKGSKNLNGPGEADQLLTEDVLLAEGPKTLLQILKEKITGFHLGTYPRKRGKPEYMVNEKKARLIFDGVDLEFFYDTSSAIGPNDHMLFIKSYLEQYNGNDVKGIEIMYNPRYNSKYNSEFLSPAEQMNASPVMGTDPVYIEITTRGGHGPFMRKTPGVVHFRPTPFSWPHEFYRPRYTAKKQAGDLDDLRATIHWQPMIITDQEGKAIVSFFTSDRSGTYTVTIEGLDDAGNRAVATKKIKVDP